MHSVIQTYYDNNQSIADRVGKTQASNWVSKPGAEETKVAYEIDGESTKRGPNNEDEVIEMVGGDNPSVMDYVNKPMTILNNSESLRPFSPPFAQVTGQSRTPNGKAAEKQKQNMRKALGKYEDSLDNKIVEYRDEEDEKINVIYDPILKCYYDPKTNAYYQLKEE